MEQKIEKITKWVRFGNCIAWVITFILEKNILKKVDFLDFSEFFLKKVDFLDFLDFFSEKLLTLE